jgi:hypothetical protein
MKFKSKTAVQLIALDIRKAREATEKFSSKKQKGDTIQIQMDYNR